MTGALWSASARDPEFEADCAALGIPVDALTAEADHHEGVWPEHVEAVAAFLVVREQWRVIPRWGAPPIYQALDYTACEATWRMAGIEMTPELFADLRLVEAGARAALNEG